jgi:hypothetical protein
MGVFFKVVFGVESGLSTIQFSTWTLDSGLSMQLFFFPVWGEGKAKGSKHLTFIPYALANVVLFSPIYVGQRGRTLYFKVKPAILGSVHSFICLSDVPIKLGC